MFPLEPSNTRTVCPENCNIDEVQCKNLKITFRGMMEVLRENFKKSLKSLWKYQLWMEINKIVQDLKVGKINKESPN